jgi:uncharacterized protein
MEQAPVDSSIPRILNSSTEITPPEKVKVGFIENKGRAVFATDHIACGEVIEVCPLIIHSRKESDFIRQESDKLKFYALELLKARCHVLHLGYGMIYNHSDDPNAEIEYESENGTPPCTVLFRALRAILPGEEIVYDYGFDEGKAEFLEIEQI